MVGGSLLSTQAWPDPATPAACNALVSGTDQLYLVDPAGKVLAQFPWSNSERDTEDQEVASVSPDGGKVAYLVPAGNDSDVAVVNAAGLKGIVPHDDPKRSSMEDPDMDDGPIMEVAWSGDDVLELTKHATPRASVYEFRKLSPDLASATGIGQPGVGTACAEHDVDEQIACVYGDVDIGDKSIFGVSPFVGLSPVASVTVTKGVSARMPGDPGYTVQVVGFDKDTIGLRLTNPGGHWSEGYRPAGDYMSDDWKFVTYGFLLTLVDKKTGTVRVDEVFAGDNPGAFDDAIAWTPDGKGLLTVYRRDGKATLYLLEPASSGAAQAANSQWQLAAQSTLDLPGLTALRMVSPSLLLLKTDEGAFILQPIKISRDTSTGKTTVSLGAAAQLPGTMDFKLADKSSNGKALDWSCKSAQ